MLRTYIHFRSSKLNIKIQLPYIDGSTAGDGTTVGKCPNSLRCISTGHCKVCKIVGDNHEGCTGSKPFCDETTNPPQCSGCAATSGELLIDYKTFLFFISN